MGDVRDVGFGLGSLSGSTAVVPFVWFPENAFRGMEEFWLGILGRFQHHVLQSPMLLFFCFRVRGALLQQ